MRDATALLLSLSLLGGLPGCHDRGLATAGELCHNGADDDDDGLIDCLDPDCQSSLGCVNAVCGDGLAEGSEECDGDDLRGRFCADLFPQGASGELGCDATCRYDTSACATINRCGNGVVETGEECDCGTDAQNLPPGCTNINGGVGSPCRADCTGSHCGNGILEPGEECDDGGTAPGDGCGPTCVIEEPCTGAGLWDECNPLDMEPCCPDDYGVELECITVQQTSYCQRGCNTLQDCYWSYQCYAGYGMCWLAYCGPEESAFDAICQVPGGGEGWCSPFWEIQDPADDRYGLCVEAGTLAPGAPCRVSSDLSYDRQEDTCANGWCYSPQGFGQGTCIQFCNWAEAHDHAVYGDPAPDLPCPTGTNCMAQSYVDPDSNGALQMGMTVCLQTTASNPTSGVDTCSLITNQLLRDGTLTCADVEPDGICRMLVISTGQAADGTLAGVCAPSAPPSRDVWEACDPALDICPAGSRCLQEDELSPNPTGPTRCVPLCDTREHSSPGACPGLGADPATTCTSISARYGVAAAYDRSRLGLCVL